ncbi:MAG TPA: hypothetical protein VFQ45_09530 [Longimicrobium sp.]|nr:hypothetical protein [Longimicrobium sp.]
MVRTSLAALAVLALAACSDSPTDTARQITRDEAENLAPVWEELSGAVLDGFGGPSLSLAPVEGAAAGTTTTTFTRTHTCPVSGNITVQGTATFVYDPATRDGSHTFAATRTDNACTINVRNGSGTISVTGNPNVALTSQQTWAAGVPGVRTATQKGGFTWSRSTGASGTCAVDLTSTWTPQTRTHTVKGTFCGHEVDVTHTPHDRKP